MDIIFYLPCFLVIFPLDFLDVVVVELINLTPKFPSILELHFVYIFE